MVSRWYELKPKATELRKKGLSFREIEGKLRIPRSTLSGWFRRVELSDKQKATLRVKWLKGIARARLKAVAWHNREKEKRIEEAKRQAAELLAKVDHNKEGIIDLALAALYLGEGFKNGVTAMGNSDPLVLKFFISVLKKNYGIPISKIKCELHLRADQNSYKIKKYWAQELDVPLANFTTISIDKRTVGRPTYPSYKGVCVVRCGNIAIQRKLMYFIQMFCEKVVVEGRVAQLVRAAD